MDSSVSPTVSRNESSVHQFVLCSGLSQPARLVIRPNRTFMYESQFFSMSCEAEDNSTGWTLRWYREKESDGEEESDCPAGWTSKDRSTCSANYLYTKDTGVYWCESESGQHSNAVEIHGYCQVNPESNLRYPAWRLRIYPALLVLWANPVAKTGVRGLSWSTKKVKL